MRFRFALSYVCALGALLATTTTAEAQSVKPHFMVMVDTSGSMGTSTGAGTNSCGQTKTRMRDAKCVIQKMVNAYGDVIFGLGKFRQTSCSGNCNWGSSACTASGPATDGQILEPIFEDNQAGILQWVDFSFGCTATTCPAAGTVPAGDSELDEGGNTPLAGYMRAARVYYQGTDPNFPGSPVLGDPFRGCRPMYVIMLTDGAETCSTFADGVNAITELRTTSITAGGLTTVHDIKTFVIGFGITPGDANIEGYAHAGGRPDVAGVNEGFYATNEDELALAISQIVASSFLTEVCDGADNDCDGMIDEGFTKYCAFAGGPLDQCTDPGDPCNGVDDNCFAGTLDEVVNACGACGPTPTEVCDGSDNDCDGFIDEGGICMGCVPEAEICDNVDNNCNGAIDEGLTRPCGSSVGECTPGTEVCTAGSWGGCTGLPPMPESCDGLDNDCDGLVDGMVQACGFPNVGQCQPGVQVCNAGVFEPCTGTIGPSAESCDLVDNNCDGTVDDGDPGGGAPCGTFCGVGVTACIGGVIVCTGGGMGMPEVCNGLDDDCDGVIDNPPPGGFPGEGVACDEMGTLCIPGVMMCVGGTLQCVGGTPPEPEVCDCNDNDCDTEVDEGMLCGLGSTCLGSPYCQCAGPCDLGEFPCPEGQICVTPDPLVPADRFCVNDPCFGVTCGPLPGGEAQVCDDGVCVGVCSLANCVPLPDGTPTACRPEDGVCVEDNCNGFPDDCTADQLCIDGVCEADPCVDVNCTPPQYCLGGTCVASCADVMCPAGEKCELGECVPDACADVMCGPSQTCDPLTGACVDDQCLGAVDCPSGQICDPVSGDCVDDPCFGVDCPPMQVCVGGSCFDESQVGADAGPPNTYVTAAGTGCACRTTGGPPSMGALLLAALAVFGVRGFRRRSR